MAQPQSKTHSPSPVGSDGAASNKTEHSANPDDVHSSVQQFKLISVDFKEAALDSPSFRASVNHLDTQVDNVEKWLIAIVSTMSKFPKYIKDIKVFLDSFLEHLIPTFLQDGLIEQEYTVQSLQTVTSGMQKLWGISLAALTVNNHNLELLKTLVSVDIKKYKRLRKRFEKLQEKYDRYLAIYQSTPKTKEPSIVREDAYQLYEVRREYIHASIDLSIELTSLGNSLDKAFVKLASGLWSSKQAIFDSFLSTSKTFQESVDKVNRIQSWCDSNTFAIEKLSHEMGAARVQVEKSTSLQFQPSQDLNDYKPSLLNHSNIQNIEEPSTEKHGYLFMKTWRSVKSKDKSRSDHGIGNGGLEVRENVEQRQIWVKRWGFIKGGVFGYLNLSPSNTFVQESDKIGLLVCNVKYAPYEDRRNCFEVKTVDSTYIFQCESVIELKSWLKVFQNEKNRVLEDQSSRLFTIASGRYPPILKELACTVNTVTDKSMTSNKIVSHSGQVITSSRLSSHIEKNEREFQKHVYYQLLQIRPPFITDSTKSAILAYSLVEPTSLPTALTANICGSINWGYYYIHDTSSYTAPPKSPPVSSLSSNPADGSLYPESYPPSMLSKDIQMRALFETAIEPGEYCLFSFRSIWSPNSRQELGGRSFVTSDHIYVYMNALGFIALFKGRIDHIVDVDYSLQPNLDTLKIHNMNGVVKMKLFLDDAAVVAKKFSYLVKNKVKDTPDSPEKLIQYMEQVDEDRKKELLNNQQQLIQNPQAPQTSTVKEPFPTINGSSNPAASVNGSKNLSFNTIPADQVKTTHYKIDYTDEATLLASATFSIPPKAIFHALLGDDSVFFSTMSAFANVINVTKKPWNTDPKTGELFRNMSTTSVYGTKTTHYLMFEQRIVKIEGNDYFNFTHTKSKFRFPIGGPFKLAFRIVIYPESNSKTRVLVYSKPVFDRKSRFNFNFVKNFCIRVSYQDARILVKYLREAERAIGNHGMVVKAIHLYGQLTKSTYVEEPESCPTIKISFVTLFNLFCYRIFLRVLGYVSQVIGIIAHGSVTFAKALKMNQLLIFFLLISSLFNLFLVGRSTSSYWTVRSVSKMARQFMTSDPFMIQKAIYLKDTQEVVQGKLSSETVLASGNISAPNSRCFETFKELSFSLNHDRTTRWESEYGDPRTREVAKGLKKSLQEIAIKRNELMIQFTILNQMEEEIALGEWKNWLLSELHRCDFITNQILGSDNAVGILESNELESGTLSILDYCNSCSNELKTFGLL